MSEEHNRNPEIFSKDTQLPKKKKGKKRKISKHIAKNAASKSNVAAVTGMNPRAAGKPTVEIDATTSTTTTLDADAAVAADNAADGTSSKKKKRRKNVVEKNPSEAASYLSAWEQQNKDNLTNNNTTSKDRSTSSIPEQQQNWKFNKNTQSWLIRHMYQAEMVSKSTFGLLLKYLKSGDDKTMQRCVHDATRRALRYQNNKKGEGQVNNRMSAMDQNMDQDDDHNDQRWNALDEHEQRKEYKRARKVLEMLS